MEISSDYTSLQQAETSKSKIKKNNLNHIDAAVPNQLIAQQPFDILEIRQTPSDSSDLKRKSPQDSKHYSENLYAIISDEMNIKRRLSRNLFGNPNPILESLASVRKIQTTKHVFRKYNNRKMERQFKFSLQNLDENLDSDDIFQSEGFTINLQNPGIIEFNIKEIDEFNFDGNENDTEDDKKYSDKVELDFEDYQFEINLTEKDETKNIGSVRLIDGSYNIFDSNGNYVFQMDKISNRHSEEHLSVLKKNIEGSIILEVANVEIRPWNLLSLQSDIRFPPFCNPKEKLMILAVVLVLMMKLSSEGRELQIRHPRNHCSVGGMWRDMVEKMKSFFVE